MVTNQPGEAQASGVEVPWGGVVDGLPVRFGLEPVESEPTEKCRAGLLGWKEKGPPEQSPDDGKV